MVQLWECSFTESKLILFQALNAEDADPGEYFTMIDENPPSSVIDNSSKIYYLHYRSIRDIALTGVVIEYTLTQPY